MAGGGPLTPGVGEGGGTGQPGPSRTPGAGQEISDQYWLRLGVRADDAEAGMRGMSDALRRASEDGARQTGSMLAGFKQLQKAAAMVGVSLSAGAIVKDILQAEQELRGLRLGFTAAAREATLGGGAMLTFVRGNEEAYRNYVNMVAEAFVDLRRNAEEVMRTSTMVAQAGVGVIHMIEGTAEETSLAIREVIEATQLAFQLEFLGFTPEQIGTIYHAMAVNLRQDVDSMKDSLFNFMVIAQDTSLSLQDQIRIVAEALNQYSKFGVTLEEVHMNLNSITSATTELQKGFMNVGMVYDILMARLGQRRRMSPQQIMMMVSQLEPDQLRQALLGAVPGETETQRGRREQAITDQLNRYLQESGVGADPNLMRMMGGRELTAADLLAGQAPLLAWPAIVRQALDPSQIAAMGGFLYQNFQQRMGRAMLPFLTQGLGVDFEELMEREMGREPRPVQGMLQTSLENVGARLTGADTRVGAILEKLEAKGFKFPEAQEQYFSRMASGMEELVDVSTGMAADIKYTLQLAYKASAFWRPESAEYRQIIMDKAATDIREDFQKAFITQPGAMPVTTGMTDYEYSRYLQTLYEAIPPGAVPALGLGRVRREPAAPPLQVATAMLGTWRQLFPEGVTTGAMQAFEQQPTVQVGEHDIRRMVFIMMLEEMSKDPRYQRYMPLFKGLETFDKWTRGGAMSPPPGLTYAGEATPATQRMYERAAERAERAEEMQAAKKAAGDAIQEKLNKALEEQAEQKRKRDIGATSMLRRAEDTSISRAPTTLRQVRGVSRYLSDVTGGQFGGLDIEGTAPPNVHVDATIVIPPDMLNALVQRQFASWVGNQRTIDTPGTSALPLVP